MWQLETNGLAAGEAWWWVYYPNWTAVDTMYDCPNNFTGIGTKRSRDFASQAEACEAMDKGEIK